VTRSWQLRIPSECGAVIIDTPAAVDAHVLPELTRSADAILVPVMPSDIDIHASAKCIADLLLVAKIRRSENRIGIIANRVRGNTLVSQSLTRFLGSLDIPLITTLRDTQSYVRSAELGVGVLEMPRWRWRSRTAGEPPVAPTPRSKYRRKFAEHCFDRAFGAELRAGEHRTIWRCCGWRPLVRD
jgi:chromosome partitioning protein